MNLDKFESMPSIEEEDEMEPMEDSEYGSLDEEGMMLAKAAGLDPKKAEAMAAFIQHCMNSKYEE